MQARQKEAAKLAAEARKTAFEAAQKEAAEKEAMKSREAVATESRQDSQNSVTGPTTVNMNEVKSKLQGISNCYRSSYLQL